MSSSGRRRAASLSDTTSRECGTLTFAAFRGMERKNFPVMSGRVHERLEVDGLEAHGVAVCARGRAGPSPIASLREAAARDARAGWPRESPSG